MFWINTDHCRECGLSIFIGQQRNVDSLPAVPRSNAVSELHRFYSRLCDIFIVKMLGWKI